MVKFLVGSQNMGMETEASDKDYYFFVVPTLAELCDSKMMSHVDQETQDKYYDVRLLPEMFVKSNPNALQLLYSVEKDDNELTQFLYENRVRLARMNLHKLYLSAMGTAKNRVVKEDMKNLTHVHFLLDLLMYVYKRPQDLLTVEDMYLGSQQSKSYGWLRENGNVEGLLESAQEKLEFLKTKKVRTFFNSQPLDEEMLEELRVFCGQYVVKNLSK